jgi:hypothetical protein
MPCTNLALLCLIVLTAVPLRGWELVLLTGLHHRGKLRHVCVVVGFCVLCRFRVDPAGGGILSFKRTTHQVVLH